MNSREAIAKLNILSSYDTEKEKREEYKECIYAIIKDLEVLEILKNKRVNINKISKVKNLCNYNSICAIGTDLTFEEYKTIKNWLERKE